jgi:hypothetical protein
MSKQTAVMYFINELKKSKDFQRVINEVNLSSTSVRDVIQETLQMETEQLIEAHNYGYFDAINGEVATNGGQDE